MLLFVCKCTSLAFNKLQHNIKIVWNLSSTMKPLVSISNINSFEPQRKMLPCLSPIKLSINIQGMSIALNYTSRRRFTSICLLIRTLFSELYTKLLKYTLCISSCWCLLILIYKGSAVCSIEFSIRLFCESTQTLKRRSICTRVQVFLKVSSITTHNPMVSFWGNRWSIV